MTRPIAARTNHDHFGFYQIGPYKTYSKIEAIEISARTGTDLKWNFNDAVFENFNWKIEPPGDLSFYYGERARQIRDKYDYLVLMYSGGADSWNMLKAFVDNNIYVDEIAHYVVKEETPLTLQEHWNAEILKTSYPTAKHLIETNPTYRTTVQRVIDGGPLVIQKISTANPHDYFYQEGGFFFGAWGTTFAEIRHTVHDYQQLIDKKKSVCFVWGYDKPTLTVNNQNKWQFHFSESASTMYVKPKHQFENRQDKFDEAFYWSPDMPEIPVKQAHLLKKYVEKLQYTDVDNFFVKKISEPPITYHINFVRNNQLLMLTADAIHKLIYPGWDINSVVASKPSSPTLSDKDQWWFRDLNDKRTSWYVRGILDLKQRIKKIHPKWWFEHRFDPANPGSFRAGITPCRNSYDIN